MKCVYAYSCVYIDSEGNVLPCCDAGAEHSFGNLNDETIAGCFSSPKANAFRADLNQNAFGKVARACKNCLMLRSLPDRSFESFQPKAAGASKAYTANFQALYNAFSGDAPVPLDAAPLSLLVQLEYTCNLRCIMCPQNRSDASVVSDKIVARIKDALPLCNSITLSGGEPLASPRFWELLDYVQKNTPPYFMTKLLTNGLLLTKDQIEKHFAGVNHLNILIDVDAARPQTYESIRVGGKWTTLMQNIEDLLEYKKHHQKPWSIDLGFAIMRRNIEEINDALALCRKMGLGFVAIPMNGKAVPVDKCRTYFTENIFSFGHLRSDAYVLEHLNDAYRTAQDLGMEGALASISATIEHYQTTARITVSQRTAARWMKLSDEDLSKAIRDRFRVKKMIERLKSFFMLQKR